MSARRFGKIDVNIRTDEDYLALSSDSTRLAFIYTFLEQKKLGGVFRSRAQYDEALGRYAQWLPELVAAELVVEHDDGSLSARTYADWQNDPAPSTERVRRWREKQRRRGTKRK